MYKNNIYNINSDYNKYIKYKYKYLQLKSKSNIQIGGSIYKNPIDTEINKFIFFINNLLDDNLTVYLKGGSVLGLKLLQIFIENNKLDNKIMKEFLKLDLIKDWDFSAYTYNVINKTYKNEAKKSKLVNRAKTFILYQSRFPIKINEDVLYEISIKENETFSNLELPLTTMQIKINKNNINNIFELSKIFYSYQLECKKNKFPKLNINSIINILSNLKIEIYPCINGIFDVADLEIDNLSNDIITLIKSITQSISEQQFLITQIIEPNRIFHRLINKNIPKSDKIKKILMSYNLYNQTDYCWILNSNKLLSLLNKFFDKLSILLKNTDINNLSSVLQGINLKRIIIEFNNFTPYSINLIKKIFIHIYPSVMENIDNISDKYIYDFFIFISRKKIF